MQWYEILDFDLYLTKIARNIFWNIKESTSMWNIECGFKIILYILFLLLLLLERGLFFLNCIIKILKILFVKQVNRNWTLKNVQFAIRLYVRCEQNVLITLITKKNNGCDLYRIFTRCRSLYGQLAYLQRYKDV